MKNKILTVILFVLFALPVPVAVVGAVVCLMWFFSSLMLGHSFVEIIMSLFGIIIGSTYFITYSYSLSATWRANRFTLKTFLPIAHCLLAFLFLLLLTPASKYISETTGHFGFAKKDFSVVEELDTHGGFHGDGSYYLILDCANNKEKAHEIIKYWKKLPLSDNLNLVMYGGKKDGVMYGYRLAEEAHIPRIENGYYFFEDRSSESKDSADDSELLNRYSFNFSLGVYDCDTDKMYYFEYDT